MPYQEAKAVVDSLRKDVHSAEDMATLQAWEHEAEDSHSVIHGEKQATPRDAVVEIAGAIVTGQEVQNTLEAGQVPEVSGYEHGQR